MLLSDHLNGIPFGSNVAYIWFQTDAEMKLLSHAAVFNQIDDIEKQEIFGALLFLSDHFHAPESLE